MVGQTSGFMPRDIRALIADASSSLIPTNGISFEKEDPQKSGESSSHASEPPKNIGSADVAPRPPAKEFMDKAPERSKKRNAKAPRTPKEMDDFFLCVLYGKSTLLNHLFHTNY